MSAITDGRHERFAQELAAGRTKDEAYTLAGFRPHRSNASRLSTKEHIRARVEELRQSAITEAAQALAIDRQWVMGRLVENVERSMQAVEVKDGKGQGTGEFRYEGAVANRALELLGKEFGMFVDRAERTDIRVEISSEPLSLEEWEAAHCEPKKMTQ